MTVDDNCTRHVSTESKTKVIPYVASTC